MTAEQAQVVVETLTGSIERESAATAKVLRAITNRDYRPDAKSRSAWELATHLAMADVWFANSIVNGAFAWAGDPPLPAEMTDPAGVASWYEKNLAEGLRRLRAMTPDQMLRPVDFFGQKQPAVGWLVLMNNHSMHHRGQLAAYLRPMGSKVPAIYGASADEPMPASA